ncbi:hypothetical protein PG_0145 [Porphyromonas gingivalis W83]|uniref:Uncharacterized protein n=1 Tax=Porphyromonas gingivalis (strain ATCC BAA-308 / W83) TaxID=242619 RepID=Q7MXM7_PORGI|nr:hypothetical protein PG_0145 [Porphyromonas gingivalis W83]
MSLVPGRAASGTLPNKTSLPSSLGSKTKTSVDPRISCKGYGRGRSSLLCLPLLGSGLSGRGPGRFRSSGISTEVDHCRVLFFLHLLVQGFLQDVLALIDLSRVEEVSRNDGQNGNDTGRPPSGLLEEIGSLADAHDLIAGCEAGCQAAPFGVLYHYDQNKEERYEQDENSQYDVHLYILFLSLIINFSKNRI